MARPLRLEFHGALYHITARGNERKNIFRQSDDYDLFLKTLAKVIGETGWICHAYCLMPNHYHLLIETPEPNLSKGMRQLNGVYTQRFNREHKRCGHLFQGRYKAIMVEKEAYLLELCRYIVLNPVRAKIVEKPEDWAFSSYRETIGITPPVSFLYTDWILGQFDRKGKKAQLYYQRFVSEGIGMPSPLSSVTAQVYLGGKDFLQEIEEDLQEKVNIEEIPTHQRHPNRPTMDELINRVAESNGVDASYLLKPRAEGDARAIAVYLCRQLGGYALKEIAERFNIGYARVSIIVASTRARVEQDESFRKKLTTFTGDQ